MRPETAAAVYNMGLAVDRIIEATVGKSFEEFDHDWLLQSAVERQFSILGEALTRVRDLDRLIYDRLPEPDKVVGLRNLLVHSYDRIDPRVIWSIIEDRLGDVKVVLDELAGEAERQGH